MKFIHIRSPKFTILPGEEAELVNPNMWGKAIALYLEERLPLYGYSVPFHVCEDWGWWVHINNAPFTLGVCIYSGETNTDGLLNFSVSHSIHRQRQWSWSKFRFCDTAPFAAKLHEDLLTIFRDDPEVTVFAVNEDAIWEEERLRE